MDSRSMFADPLGINGMNSKGTVYELAAHY